jgi:hypothetical protein
VTDDERGRLLSQIERELDAEDEQREVFSRPPNELAWRRWLATLDPWTRAAYARLCAALTAEERDTAMRWGEIKLRRLGA